MQEESLAKRLKRTVCEYSDLLNLIFESDVFVHLVMELDFETYAIICRLNKHYHSRSIKFQGEKVKQWLEYQTHHWSTDNEEKAIALARSFRMFDDGLVSLEEHSALSKCFFTDAQIYKFGLSVIAGNRPIQPSAEPFKRLLPCLTFSHEYNLSWTLENLNECRLPGRLLLNALPKIIPRFLLIELALQGYDDFVLGVISERQILHDNLSFGPFSLWQSLEDFHTDRFPMLLKNIPSFGRDLLDFKNPNIHRLMYNDPGFVFLLAHPYFISFSTFCISCDMDYTEDEFNALGFDVNQFITPDGLVEQMSIRHLPPLWVWKKLWTTNPKFMDNDNHTLALRSVCCTPSFRREADPVFLFFVESGLLFDILKHRKHLYSNSSPFMFLRNLCKRFTKNEWEKLVSTLCQHGPELGAYVTTLDRVTI